MLVRLLAVALAAAAYAPAAYAENCFGSDQTHRVCLHPENVVVDSDGGRTVGDCFWINSTQCVPIFVTLPSVTTTGPLADHRCGALTC